MSSESHGVVSAIEAEIRTVTTVDELGHAVAGSLAAHIPIDRFNIGRIDTSRNLFYDEFVFGHNVAGRPDGHQRTLDGSVVEAAIQVGPGFYFGNPDLQQWLARFPRFGPVYESGIRAMMAVPLRDGDKVVATLVFASRNPGAYGRAELAIAVAARDAIESSRIFVALFCAGS